MTRIRNPATGEVRDHAGGLVPDGWWPATSILLLDGGAGPGAATLGAAQRILGDGFDAAEYSRLSDQAARHAVVRKRIGAAAEGKPATFLDAAWSTLAGTSSTPAAASDPLPTLPAAQRAVAASAVERALADHAARHGGARPVSDADAQAGRDAAAGAHDTRTRLLGDRWKSPEHLARDQAYTEALAGGGGDARAAYRARCAMQAASWRGSV